MANIRESKANYDEQLKKFEEANKEGIKVKIEVEKAELVKKAKRLKRDITKYKRHVGRARRIFRNECISSYKETRYSANKKAIKMLEEVGITEPRKRMRQHPFEMSGGMLQRCMIAMALVS